MERRRDEAGRYIREEPLDIFYSNIKKDQATGCWNWTSRIFVPGGYGQFKCTSMRKMAFPAHRAAWMLLVGEIPKGLFVCHKCDNRLCCNPDHLFLGICKENMEDCVAKGRTDKGEDRHNAVLTEWAVQEMRRIRAERGTSYRKLAKMFGVCATNCHIVVNGMGWKHI